MDGDFVLMCECYSLLWKYTMPSGPDSCPFPALYRLSAKRAPGAISFLFSVSYPEYVLINEKREEIEFPSRASYHFIRGPKQAAVMHSSNSGLSQVLNQSHQSSFIADG